MIHTCILLFFFIDKNCSLIIDDQIFSYTVYPSFGKGGSKKMEEKKMERRKNKQNSDSLLSSGGKRIRPRLV
ncbi:hypothetical protein VNO78_23949 [Psophocarpus tetragonolobus]|uniref:Uncharacterized protein n=1 Tax=Psophocarpus tetragonolobus TaxID=3891 RepID=A0AAN9S4J2_PSOTE